MKNILRNSSSGFTKWCVALIAAGWMGAAQAQVSINGSAPVVENFNTLGTSATAALPSGWKMSAAGAGTTAGYSTAANVTATTQAGSGASTAGGRYNWGDGATATDRAIGFMTSGSYASPSGIMAQYQNNTGGTISTLILSFDIERYRINTAAAQVTFFSSTDGTTWTSQTSGDSGAFTTGTSSYTLTAPSQTVVSKTVAITGLSIANGSSIYFKWNFNTTGASSQGLGLDNVSVTATTSGGGTPPTITGISPSSGLAGTIVSITGTDFTGATSVRFNGLAANSFTVNSSTSITATAPTGVTTGPISVTTTGGTATSSNNFTVPVLSITVPTSINEGDSSQIAVVTATPAPTSNLTITLTSSSGTDLKVDGGSGAGATATATIVANTTDASFFLDAPADNTVDNDASVNLTATAASGYNSATAIVTVRNLDFNPPTIVVNKAYNSGGASGADDVVELLVIGNGTPGSNVNLQGMILKDYSSSAASDGGGSYIFANDPLWSSVKAGTLIVLTKPGTTSPAEDVDSSDFVIKVNLSNVTYFTVGTGVFDVGGTELIQIKASGSALAGSAGVIHSFAIGTTSAAQVAVAPLPKLICFNSGNNPFATSSTKTLADFNGTGAAQSASPLGMGIPNNTDNATYISSLRGSKDITVSIDSSIAIIREDAGLQAGKITVALSEVTNSDLSVTLSVTPSGAATIPVSVVIPSGASSATIDFNPINDSVITGNRAVTISGSASGWNSGNSTATVVDVQFNNPSVVINEVVNGGTGGADALELLVIQNNLNMVGMILKDFSTNMTGDAGRQFTFADNALWQSVRAGTLLVLTSDAAATEDTDPADGVVTVKLTNTTYFAATGGSFDISNVDMVMIKSSGSGGTGILGAIHTFGSGAAGSLFNLANGAKLLFTAGGAGGGADNATSAIGDYNGTGATVGNTLGTYNNSQNQAYIAALRASVNSAPTEIGLTATSIAENNAVNAVLGTLSSTDADSGDTFTYSLVPGTGDTDNASFNINGTSLRAGGAFDFETKSSYSVRVRTTDSANNTFEKVFTITVTNVNESPTDIRLTPAIIAENSAVNTVVGTLTTTDVDSGDIFTYSLVAGDKDIDNASFNISGNSLRASARFDFETKSSYNVRVRATDSANNTFEKAFTIMVEDLPEALTYSSWLGALTPSDAAFLDYVFGAATPGTLDPSLKPSVAVTAGNLVLTYYVRQGTAGLTVTPKTSADMAAGPSGWVTTGVTDVAVGVPISVSGVSVQQRTASVPVSGAKKFLRVEAVQQ